MPKHKKQVESLTEREVTVLAMQYINGDVYMTNRPEIAQAVFAPFVHLSLHDYDLECIGAFYAYTVDKHGTRDGHPIFRDRDTKIMPTVNMMAFGAQVTHIRGQLLLGTA